MDCETIRLPQHRWALDKQSFHPASHLGVRASERSGCCEESDELADSFRAKNVILEVVVNRCMGNTFMEINGVREATSGASGETLRPDSFASLLVPVSLLLLSLLFDITTTYYCLHCY